MNLLQKKQRLEFLKSQQDRIEAERNQQKKNEKAFVQGILDEWKAKNK